MIVIVSPDLSREVVKPIRIRQIYGEEAVIEIVPEMYGLARELEVLDDPLSDGALALVWSRSADYLEKIGYADDRFRARRNLVFEKSAAPVKSYGNSVRLDELEKYENLTTIKNPRMPCFATVTKGKIVSLAAAYEADDGAYEICVETAPGYRGRGYATENVGALSDYLVEEGKRVRYLCAESNEKSRRVAARAGFSPTGKSYTYTVRRKEKGNGI